MRTRTGAAILSAASFFLLTGLALRSWEMISLIVPLILMVTIAPIIFPGAKVELRVSRTIDNEKPQKGEEVVVCLRIENLGRAFDMVQIEDALPEGSSLAGGRNRFPIGMKEAETAEVFYRLAFPLRGRYLFRQVTIISNNPLYATRRSTTLELPGEVKVTPRVQDMKKVTIHQQKVRMAEGDIRSKLLGPGNEFFGLRDYWPGDSLRHVNWKASARRDRLVTNEYEMEKISDVTMVIDARTSREGCDLEAAVEAAASLSSHFLKRRDRVGMIIVGQVVDVIKADSGKRQMHRIMDGLTRLRPGTERSAVNIRLALNRYFRGDSMLVLISPMNDRRMVETSEEIVRKGHRLLVISPRPVMGPGDNGKANALAFRMEAMRRTDALYELGRFCRVVDWDTGKPLMSYFGEVRTRQKERNN